MSMKLSKPRLSKGILEMKFMQRTKKKVDAETEKEEGIAMYSSEITDKMLQNKTNFILEHSFVHCENLIEGRLSFRGMNPEIERLLELEQAEREAAVCHDQPKEVSDQEMVAFYHKQQAPAASKVMQKKFQNKNFNKRKSEEGAAGTPNKKNKFQRPRDEDV